MELPPAVLHHVGLVVPDIRAAAVRLATALGLPWDAQVVHDPVQKVHVTFLGARTDPGSLELVQPAEEQSPASALAGRGGGLHHVCYEVEDLGAWLDAARSGGCMMVSPPVPAVAFQGRRIAWIYSRDRLLVEVLER